ncbi:MAG: hypothetical protein DWI09_09985, partial [Planctomycetota bacterium]
SLAADKTLSLDASEVSGQTVSGTGSIIIIPSTLTGTSDLRNIAATINLTVPSPFTVSGGSSSLSIRGNQLGSLSFDGGGALVIDGAMGTNDLATRASGVTLSFLNSSVSTGSTVTLTAAQANGKAISGAGTTSISGNILASANFTQISTTLNIPGQVNLAATLTLTAAQSNGRTLTGAGNIFITTADLSDDTNFRGLNTAEVAFSGSIASGKTLSINAFQATMSVSGAGTVNVLGTAGGDTVAGSSLTANVIASGLAGADSITSSSGNDTLSGGDDSDTIAAGAGTNSIDGGAGIDNALLSSTYATTTFSAPANPFTVSSSSFTDSISTVETITCSDATVNVIATGGSSTASLNAALESGLSGKLYGNLAIDSTTFTTAAELNAILARVVSGSALTVNVIGMNTEQLAAVAASSASFPTLAYPPVQVVSSGNPSGYFTTIQAGITFATAGDTVNVAAGTYAEDLAVDRALSLRGPNYGINPNTGTRAAEAIVYPATNNVSSGKLIQVLASNVSIDGLTLDGDNPAISGGTSFGGVDSNCARAVRNQNAAGTGIPLTGMDLSNCVVKNFITTGYYLEKFSASPIAASGNYVRNNLFSNMLYRAVYTQCDIVATNNVITDTFTGIAQDSVGLASAPGFTPIISGNTITLANTGSTVSRHMGISINNRFGSAPLLNISNNVINGSASINRVGEAIRITSSSGGAQVHATGNVIDGAGTLSTGYWIWNTNSLSDVVVSGGSVSGVTANGVYLTDFDVAYGTNSQFDGNFATLDSVAISTTATGKAVNVHWTGTGSNLGPCTLTVRNGVA